MNSDTLDARSSATTFDARFPVTSPTLLRAVAASPSSARWNDFANLYEPVVRRYLSRERMNFRALSAADRDDLVQETFLAVSRALPSFRYDPGRGRFRNYLFSVVRNLVVKSQRAANGRLPVPVEDAGENDAADDAPRAEGEERELMLETWTLALARVFARPDFAANTKAVFRAFALEDRPAASVAEEFRMKPNAVYQVKDRVLRAVRRELAAFGHGRVSLADLHEALLAAGDAP